MERRDRLQAGFNRLEGGDTELCRSFCSDRRVAIDDCGELNRLPGLFEFTIDAKMIAPEGSRSDDGDAEWMRGRHYFFSVRFSVRFSGGASTTWRQRA